MTIRGTLTVIRVKKTTNDNSSQWNFLHPLAGLWKSCTFALSFRHVKDVQRHGPQG